MLRVTRAKAEEVFIVTVVMVLAVVVVMGTFTVAAGDALRDEALRVKRERDGRSLLVRSPIEQPLIGVAPPKFAQLATSAALLCGVPPRLFKALVARESSWRQWDRNGVLRSTSGALGLAQVKPSTARDVSPTLDLRDPWQNLLAGACYLRMMYDLEGTWRSALHAYHAGPNRTHTRQASKDYADVILAGGSVE